MSGLHDPTDDAATDLSPEEREGLIPAHITTRAELNEAEFQNILEASLWAFERKRPLTTEAFAKRLHQAMYGKVWRWAGTYRETGKNIGVDPNRIQLRLYETMEQFRYWIEHPEIYAPDELTVRFHHALVLIHPFPNGNGRWSRLMGDLLAVQLGRLRFTWGGGTDLGTPGDMRNAYIAALRIADTQDDTVPLLNFARS
jgi:Fic-DOC domain mobile mystery protein B